MSAHLSCDQCHQPKESTTHYGLVNYIRVPTRPSGQGYDRNYAGAIDICDDCRDRLSHDGRDGIHKRAAIVRIEMGKVTR